MIANPAAPEPLMTIFKSSNRFFCHLACIDEGGKHDNGSPVLVIVHHRNANALQCFLELEALGRRNVLERDPAKNRCYIFNLVSELRVVALKTDRERIDVCEFFEKKGFTLHDRDCGIPPDVSQ